MTDDGNRPWVIRTPPEFFDVQAVVLSDCQKVMAGLLEGMARDLAGCFPSNDLLMVKTGKSSRAVKNILDGLEKAGWIARVYTEAQRRERMAILLLKRVDPALPYIPPDKVDDAKAAIIECRKLHAQTGENCTREVLKAALSRVQKTAPEALRSGTMTKSTRGVANASGGGKAKEPKQYFKATPLPPEIAEARARQYGQQRPSYGERLAAERKATLDKIEAWKLQRKAEDEAAKAKAE